MSLVAADLANKHWVIVTSRTKKKKEKKNKRHAINTIQSTSDMPHQLSTLNALCAATNIGRKEKEDFR